MAITTTNIKAAIEAKIAAATGLTPLEDLTIIKSDADLWLRNNSGGSITGYATLESLIQTKENALTGASTLDDITLAAVAAYPPQEAGNISVSVVPGIKLSGAQVGNALFAAISSYGASFSVTGVDASASLVDLCNIAVPSGKKMVVKRAAILGLTATAQAINIQIEIDGVIVLQNASASTNVDIVNVVGGAAAATPTQIVDLVADSSFKVKLQKAAATSAGINVTYILVE